MQSQPAFFIKHIEKCEVDMKELTVEKVVEILGKNGTFVTPDEAKIILSFMINLASISLDQIFEHES